MIRRPPRSTQQETLFPYTTLFRSGLAKTLTIKTLAQAINGDFSRIQFTPDLLPADIVGTMIYNPADNAFSVRKGPIFANFVLADEINRAPAKVQAALLEAMQERQVTIGPQTFTLEEPFLVLATQNPIEQEGTYNLPEAQVDRFMLKVKVSYPQKEEERIVMQRALHPSGDIVEPVLEPAALLRARETVREIYLDEKVEQYILDLVFATREPVNYGLGDWAPYISVGASPRATINMALAAKAAAFMDRKSKCHDDTRSASRSILNLQRILAFGAEFSAAWSYSGWMCHNYNWPGE